VSADSRERVGVLFDRLTVERWRVLIGVNPETVYKWIDRKTLPAHEMGRIRKFKATEVDEWVPQGKAAEEPKRKETGDNGH